MNAAVKNRPVRLVASDIDCQFLWFQTPVFRRGRLQPFFLLHRLTP